MSKESPLNAVVTMRAEVAPSLAVLRVAPLGWQLPPFKPGQFAVLGLPASSPRHPMSDPEDEPPPQQGGMLRRSYSIASSSREDEYLEFYLTLVRSGALTPRLFALTIGDRLWLGPKISGLFTFEDLPADARLVLLATGTGLAPYISMLRTRLDDERRQIALIHGARHSWDLGYRDELVAMTRLRPNLTYIPTISRPDEEPVPWIGEVGYVQDLWRRRVIEQRWGRPPRPEDTHVFLCGNPAMIEHMLRILAEDGFREHTRLEPGPVHCEKYW